MSLSLTAPLLGHLPSLYSFLIQRYLVFSIHFLQAVGYSVFVEDFNRCNQTSRTRHHRRLRHPSGLDNPTDHFTSQFLSLLSSFSLAQHVTFPIHDKNHILDLVITSADTSLNCSGCCFSPISLHPITFLFSPNFLQTQHHFLLQHFTLSGGSTLRPARTALSSKPAARRCCCRSMEQTDGRTDGRTRDRFIDPAPHTMRALSLQVDGKPVGERLRTVALAHAQTNARKT